MWIRTSALAMGTSLVLAVGGAVACSSSNQPPPNIDMTAAAAGGEVNAGGADTTSVARLDTARVRRSSDANIFALLHEANQGEIAAAQLAQQRTRSDQVRAFAQRMINDHTRLDRVGDSLARALGVTPRLPDSSLARQQAAARSRLQSDSATSFDRLYIGQQVVAHERALALVDSSIARAGNPSLESALERRIQPVIAEHLRMAQDLDRRLRSGTP